MSDELRAWMEGVKQDKARAYGPNVESTKYVLATWAMRHGDSLIAKVDELARALERAEAGVWDAYYGRGISVEYARSVRAEAQSALRAPGGGEDA